MRYYTRILSIDLPVRQSAFLWGARKTGKSTYLHKTFPQAIFYDLLKRDEYLRLSTNPSLFRQEIEALLVKQDTPIIVVVDEVQKIPELLDEIHYLIENTDAQFILCGSSARKLKRQGVNLLGGRAWKFHFFPLVFPEIPDFDLLKILQKGTIPSHFDSSSINRSLKAYIEDYLVHEIQEEGLVRHLPAFSRFLESLAFSHGEMVNYANIARDCHVDGKTVKSYYQILVDTLLGYFLYPYHHRVKRDIISETPKFYFFDIGVANYIKKINIDELKGVEAGNALEHYIFMELIAYSSLKEKNFDIRFWRTKSGLEVDFIIGKAEFAIEVKISSNVALSDVKGLIAFKEEYPNSHAIVICMESRSRRITIDNSFIDFIPVKTFLNDLWAGKWF